MGSLVHDETELKHEGPTLDDTVGDELGSPQVDTTPDPMGVTGLASSNSLLGDALVLMAGSAPQSNGGGGAMPFEHPFVPRGLNRPT
jgi:hypothetical protein